MNVSVIIQVSKCLLSMTADQKSTVVLFQNLNLVPGT